MKNVWILNHYAQEPGGAGGIRHYALAHNLRAHGWNAFILAASLEHGTGRQRLGDDEISRLDVKGGVPFLWLRTRSYLGNGLNRILNMIDYTRAVLDPANLAELPRPDVIIGSSVHPLAAWAGRRLARRYKVPFIFEVRDLWPQTLIDMGRLSKRHPAAIALRLLEKSLYRSAARIITLLPLAHEYIEPLGISRSRIVWIPNGVDLEGFPSRPPAETAGVFRLGYFGAHGTANGLDNLIRAMKFIENRRSSSRFKLELTGNGPEKPKLEELVEELQLENVTFSEPVSKSAIPDIAARADALVFNLQDIPVFKYGISSNKLFDYLASERPIIFCCKAANNPVAEAGAGITVPPEDPAALADAIVEMAETSPEQREAMGRAGRRYVEENHGMDILARRLAETLDAALED